MKNKSALEHFKDIEELETGDGPKITVEDILPYKCEQVEQALKRLEAIDNANPSEALDRLYEIIDYYNESQYDVCENSFYNEFKDMWGKEINTIKQALLKQQQPKHYLKWEDLEFNGNNEHSYFKVKLGDNVYKAFSYFSYVFNKDTVVIKANYQFAITEDNKQFFNDLHLERVE